VIGVAGYTAVMFSLANNLSRRFGPQVRTDLEWRVQRGAQELARNAEIGLAISDKGTVESAFGVYATSADVQAIVAMDAAGAVVAQHGVPPRDIARLFAGEPRGLAEGPGYLVSWAPALIESQVVGKVAVVVSTGRLLEAQRLLDRSSNTTLVGGAAALLLGALVLMFFTRAVAQRDARLSDYAANLELKVDERTRELDERNRGMRLVLDNVAQGFITIGSDGVMAAERSAVVDRWFGTPPPQCTLADYVRPKAPTFAQWLDIGLDQLRDDLLPAELTLDQMPKRFNAGERTFDVTYSRIGKGEKVERLLVILSDITDLLARERADAEQKELVGMFQRISVDRTGVEEFLTEAAALVGALRTEQDPVTQKRLVHTLKGNCAIYGLESFAELAHVIESELAETGANLSDAQRTQLVSVWKQAMQRVGVLLGSARREVFEIEKAELDAVIGRLRATGPANDNDIAATLVEWSKPPVTQHLERLARQSLALARRIAKPEPKIVVKGRGVRLDPSGWAPYWSAMVHLVRNAVDHGIEDAESRALAGKAEAATLEFSAQRHGEQLIISVRDDGRGIDWERVRAKAEAAGLPSQHHTDLVEALFSDGFSTRDEATAVSGRGVGLGALRAVVQQLGGRIEVETTLGRGTVFRSVFNEKAAIRAAASAPRVAASSLLPAATL
jgi:two-component system chemotaxis sensor kinase CheA